MGQEQKNKGHQSDSHGLSLRKGATHYDDFVLEKGIFAHIFEKDIRRVFIYKKAERMAKAIQLITPAFADSPSLKNRIGTISVTLVDAATLPPSSARAVLARELLALSSVLSIARSGGLLSAMNADLVAREAHLLLQEIAAYEEPRLSLDEAPTLSEIARHAEREHAQVPVHVETPKAQVAAPKPVVRPGAKPAGIKDMSDTAQPRIKDRRDGVMSVIRNKGRASIKDISTVIRGVSEKTIQRELQALVESGLVRKQGERRWSTYSLA